jgi:heme/copper-type cytochrome/quinol oxidase subunit 4
LQTKSYIWGYITGIGTILVGLVWVPFEFNAMVFGSWMEGPAWYMENAPDAVIRATVIAIALTSIGLLVVFKKALGWHLIWLILLAFGVIFLSIFVGMTYTFIMDAGTSEADLFGISLFSALSVFFLTLLWVQIRYWRSRRAM